MSSLCPEAGHTQVVPGYPFFYPETSRERPSRTMVYSKQASFLPAAPSLGSDVTGNETSS